MAENLTAGTICIINSAGAIAGTGFIVTDDGLIATCAHVVGSDSVVWVVFHKTDTRQQADVLSDRLNPDADVAFLQLRGARPKGVTPLPIGPSEDCEGHPYLSLGYPEDGEVEARWPQGHIGGPVPVGGHRWLQIQGAEVDKGMSGAPVFDRENGYVVGMLTGYKDLPRAQPAPDVRFAYAIPTEALIEVCPGLARVLRTRPLPFMAYPLPADFVQRPVEFEPLVDVLLAENEGLVGITTALRGAGGYGKTTLATALCHDERVRAAFPDGILWATLGQEPNLVGGAIKLLRALTGERPALVDVEDAAQELAQALGDKRCLLVIDDVWNEAHTRLFLRDGPRCTRLITTRNRDTLPPDTHTVDVDAMRPSEAIQLLGAGLDIDVGQHGILPQLTQLATRLGEWPLLLGLANGALRRRINQGQSLPNALTWVERSLEKRGLTAFDARDAQARDQAAALTLEVSLELLNEDERARYGELAVFPEDEQVPLQTVARLWGATGGLDDFDAEELCGQLFDLSLLRRFDLAARAIQLHDVVRDYLTRQQGDRLPALHNLLLQAYAAACQRGPDGTAHWPTGPDDGYYFQHLVSHLHQAGRAADARALLLNFKWLWAKLHATNVNALIADYNLPPVGGTEGGQKALRLIQGALQLSAHVLARDPTQLPGQMLGRLMSFWNDDIHGLTAQIENYRETFWLRPLTASLTPPGGPLLRTLTGHNHFIEAVAVTPNGQRAISASYDQTLKIWDLESGEELCTLMGHSGYVSAVAVTPDGRRVVSASYDDTLKVWDLESGEELRTLIGHSNAVKAVAVTPDGRWVVSALSDRTLKVWDLESGEELRTLKGHEKLVGAVAVTPDGRWVVLALSDRTLKVWDLESGEELRTLRGHSGPVMAVVVTPDGRRVVSASHNHTLKVWDLESGELVATFSADGGLYTCAIVPDSGCSKGDMIIASGARGGFHFLRLEGVESLRR